MSGLPSAISFGKRAKRIGFNHSDFIIRNYFTSKRTFVESESIKRSVWVMFSLSHLSSRQRVIPSQSSFGKAYFLPSILTCLLSGEYFGKALKGHFRCGDWILSGKWTRLSRSISLGLFLAFPCSCFTWIAYFYTKFFYTKFWVIPRLCLACLELYFSSRPAPELPVNT